MKKLITHFFLFIAVVTSQSSCNTARKDDCGKHIAERIKPGLPLDLAESELKRCAFKITLDPTKKTLYGDKVVEGKPISERTQVLIRLDSNNKVVSINVSTGLIGP